MTRTFVYSILAAASLLAASSTTSSSTNSMVWAAPSPLLSKRQGPMATPMGPLTDPTALAPPTDPFAMNSLMDPAVNVAGPPIDPTAVTPSADPTAMNLLPPQLMNGVGPAAGGLLPPSPLGPQVQVVPQQDIQIGSETDVLPTTGVFPKLIFQPAIQLFDPFVTRFPSFGSILNGAFPGAGTPLIGDPFMNLGMPGPAIPMMNSFGGSMPPMGEAPLAAGPGPGPVGLPGAAGPGPGLAGVPGAAPLGPMFRKRQLDPTLGGPLTGCSGTTGAGLGIVGTPSGIATDTLIQPIVTIQPHALQPVGVPVSQPYSYPVPVSVPSPWFGTPSPACGTGCATSKWGSGCWGGGTEGNGWEKWSQPYCDQCGGLGAKGR